jgi:riboflavin-specific deaminase-like protein
MHHSPSPDPALRPFVTANFAISADGRISSGGAGAGSFSSPRDKRRLLEIRSACDAILVGARTLAADSMTLGLPAADLRAARRRRGQPNLPLRVIVSNSGRVNPALRIFRTPGAPIFVFATRRMPQRIQRSLRASAQLCLDDSSRVSLAGVLETLHRAHAVRRLVCEGGGELFRNLLSAGLVDELHLTICPRVFATRDAPTLTGLPGRFLPRSANLALVSMDTADGECFTRWKVAR